MLEIRPIKAFSDNYIWTFQSENGVCAVDPGDAVPLLDWLAENRLSLATLLLTHHHPDHIGGLASLRERFSSLQVYGPASIAGVTHPVSEGGQISLGELTLDVIATPGHTLDHLAYLGADFAFTGDTLFAAGCGRLFEGTPEMMYQSLSRLAGLPDTTRLYPAHEYTLANLYFAQACEPDNLAIKDRLVWAQQCMASKQPTLPVLLSTEKASNPFLRASLPSLAAAASSHTGCMVRPGLETFTILRQWKNEFVR